MEGKTGCALPEGQLQPISIFIMIFAGYLRKLVTDFYFSNDSLISFSAIKCVAVPKPIGASQAIQIGSSDGRCVKGRDVSRE